MDDQQPQDPPAVPADCSTAYRKLSDAVERFLQLTGYRDLAEDLTDAVLHTEHYAQQMGTLNFKELDDALRANRHSETKIGEPEKLRRVPVTFVFGESDYESLAAVERRTGWKFRVVRVTDSASGRRREILIPESP